MRREIKLDEVVAGFTLAPRWTVPLIVTLLDGGVQNLPAISCKFHKPTVPDVTGQNAAITSIAIVTVEEDDGGEPQTET